jgi:hypothetical protein
MSCNPTSLLTILGVDLPIFFLLSGEGCEILTLHPSSRVPKLSLKSLANNKKDAITQVNLKLKGRKHPLGIKS